MWYLKWVTDGSIHMLNELWVMSEGGHFSVKVLHIVKPGGAKALGLEWFPI